MTSPSTPPTPTTTTTIGPRPAPGRTAANELRALRACRQLEGWGIHGATPAYDPAEGGYTGQVAVDPDELLRALNTASEGEW
jgi:hypothetical protein